MIYQGVDTAARISAAQAAKIAANGLSFVGRYLVPETLGKALTADEATALRDAGLAILLCWEMGPEDMKGGAAKGAEHGARARQLAESLGVPSGTTIFFAADYNVPYSDLILCEQYITAAQAALGKYRAGAYGGERLVSFFADRGLPVALWQCVAWTSQFSDAASVIQYAWQGASDAKAMAAKLGFAVDLDSCEDMRLAGLWMPKAKKEPWYAADMALAAERGLMNDGRPTDNVTRAELAVVANRLYDTFVGDKRHSGLLED